ncbi:MAG: SH3 domain-containing protein [Oscillospiraceae bacterium]|nr:SH3 domain-containing protein [Oscillospiraceae bacterium]
MKKRCLTALLALLLVLLLCACGRSEAEVVTQSATPAPEGTETEAPETQEPFVVGSLDEGETGTEAQPSEETPVPTPALSPVTLRDDDVLTDTELVRVRNYIPDLRIDLKYASTDNYTGNVVYTFDEPYLRYGTVKKLAAAQAQLKERGYELVLWDAFRPTEAQYVLYDAFPNSAYVANPYGGGHSSHTNGGTVDVGLMKDGALVALPSGFDEFSALGDRNYSDVSQEAAANAGLLEDVMVANDFTGYYGEWWHFSDNEGYNYTDVETAVLPEKATNIFAAECNEYINIRRMPNAESEAIGSVPNGEQMTVLGYVSDFLHIRYGEQIGYVNAHYTVAVN